MREERETRENYNTETRKNGMKEEGINGEICRRFMKPNENCEMIV